MKPATAFIIETCKRTQAFRMIQYPPEYVKALRDRDAKDYWRAREQGGSRYAARFHLGYDD